MQVIKELKDCLFLPAIMVLIELQLILIKDFFFQELEIIILKLMEKF